MDLNSVHPVVADIFRRQAIRAAATVIGIREPELSRWVVARRVIEPILSMHGEEVARAALEDYKLPSEVLLLEIPEIRNLRHEVVDGENVYLCEILDSSYRVSHPTGEDHLDRKEGCSVHAQPAV